MSATAASESPLQEAWRQFRRDRIAMAGLWVLLGLLATVAGVACSAVASAVFADQVLDVRWTPAWGALALPLVAIPGICIATARAATAAVLRERPLALLQAVDV